MGTTNYGTGTQIVRWFFVICNAFFLLCGILEFAIGVWSVATSDGSYDVITGTSNVSSGAILLVSGIIVFALSLVGFLGGIFMSRVLLIIYAIVLGVIMFLQFVGAVLALAFSDTAGSQVRDNMEEALERYRVLRNDSDYDDDVNDAVEYVQDIFDCCGIDNSSDWVELNKEAVMQNGNVPPGDCDCDPEDEDEDDCVQFYLRGVPTGNYVWSRGCLTLIEDSLQVISIVNGVIGLIIVAIEVAFLAMAIGLTCCVHSARKNAVV